MILGADGAGSNESCKLEQGEGFRSFSGVNLIYLLSRKTAAAGGTGPLRGVTWRSKGSPTQLPDRALCTSVHCRHHLTGGQQHHATVSGSLSWEKKKRRRSRLPGLGEVPAAKTEPRGLPASPALWLVPPAAAQPGPHLICVQPPSPSHHCPALLSSCSVSLWWSSRQQPFPSWSCFQPPSETSSLFPWAGPGPSQNHFFSHFLHCSPPAPHGISEHNIYTHPQF